MVKETLIGGGIISRRPLSRVNKHEKMTPTTQIIDVNRSTYRIVNSYRSRNVRSAVERGTEAWRGDGGITVFWRCARTELREPSDWPLHCPPHQSASWTTLALYELVPYSPHESTRFSCDVGRIGKCVVIIISHSTPMTGV